MDQLNKRQRRVRRLLAAGFLFVLFAGLGAQAALESRFSGVSEDAAWCDVTHHIPHSADCPHNRKPGVPEKDLFREVTHHWIVTADLSVPVSGILYRSEGIDRTPASPISRPHTPPFQPPKQS